MHFVPEDFEKLIFMRTHTRREERTYDLRRFTQDSPVYPDVWLAYFSAEEDRRVELLLTPHRQSTAAELLTHLRDQLRSLYPEIASQPNPPWRLANSGDAVAAKLSLDELIRAALPLTKWWRKYLWAGGDTPTPELNWFMDIVGAALWSRTHAGHDEGTGARPDIENLQETGAFQSVYEQRYADLGVGPDAPMSLWSVSRNRAIELSLAKSVPATKADATRRLFGVDGAGISWAILDSGVDATHPAFRAIDPKTGMPFEQALGAKTERQPNHTRVVATYDFTKFRDLMVHLCCQSEAGGETKRELRQRLFDEVLGPTGNDQDRPLTKKEAADMVRDLERAVKNGRMLDWSAIGPLLRMPHNQDDYQPPEHPHGTHVAGILGANMHPREGSREDALVGMCPGIEIYDLRVMGADGFGDEFGILAALQFVRWLNKQQDQLIIHGANLSLSLPHAVANYACGRTPVCEECQRLVAEGTVVVAAAGNRGRAVYQTQTGPDEGFRTLSITDPGNAEAVITVGATHREKPHTYGVSYFSSRGPTGDGRAKPDLLAPGEKVISAVPGDDTERMDGTSMAAPHVSGAAALLLARHREMIGQPARVKEVLCKTAVDLGRERYFQGYGLVDTLAALQSL